MGRNAARTAATPPRQHKVRRAGTESAIYLERAVGLDAEMDLCVRQLVEMDSRDDRIRVGGQVLVHLGRSRKAHDAVVRDGAPWVVGLDAPHDLLDHWVAYRGVQDIFACSRGDVHVLCALWDGRDDLHGQCDCLAAAKEAPMRQARKRGEKIVWR